MKELFAIIQHETLKVRKKLCALISNTWIQCSIYRINSSNMSENVGRLSWTDFSRLFEETICLLTNLMIYSLKCKRTSFISMKRIFKNVSRWNNVGKIQVSKSLHRFLNSLYFLQKKDLSIKIILIWMEWNNPRLHYSNQKYKKFNYKRKNWKTFHILKI